MFFVHSKESYLLHKKSSPRFTRGPRPPTTNLPSTPQKFEHAHGGNQSIRFFKGLGCGNCREGTRPGRPQGRSPTCFISLFVLIFIYFKTTSDVLSRKYCTFDDSQPDRIPYNNLLTFLVQNKRIQPLYTLIPKKNISNTKKSQERPRRGAPLWPPLHFHHFKIFNIDFRVGIQNVRFMNG